VLEKLPSGADGQSEANDPTRAAGARTSLAVLIVGMHRSGTSALGGVLNLLGVPAPAEQVETDHHNIRGYFEPQRIVDFHEALFARLGSPSNDPLPLTYDWLRSPVGRAAAEDLAELLETEFAGEPVRLFKDPRMCRLLPVWTEALALLGRPAVAVLPCRHPLEVAGSLAAKAGLSQPYSLFMWLQHVVYGERFSRGMTRSFTLYDDLMGDWRGLIAKVERELGLTWPRDLMRAAPEIDAFLSGDLRHHSAVEARLDPDDPLQALCSRAWDACKRLRDDPDDKQGQAALDAVGVALVEGVGMFGPLVVSYQREVERLLGAHDALRVRDRVIAEQVQAVQDRDAGILARDARIQELAAAAGKLVETEKALATVRARVTQRNQELRWANQGIRDRDRAIVERDDLVRRLETERRNWEVAAGEVAVRMAALENSTSWKLTHALRLILRRFPLLRTVLRRGARLAWWTLTLKLGRRLRERETTAPDAPPPPTAVEPAATDTTAQAAAEGAAEAPEPPLHVAFLSGEPDTPGHKYRVVRHADAARVLGATVSVTRIDQAHAELDAFRKADLIYIWRAAWDEVNVEAVLAVAKATGAPVVFDIDDLIVEPALVQTDIIDGLRSQDFDHGMIRDYFARLQRTLIAADYACAPTPSLSRYLQRYSKTVYEKLAFRIPNGFDEEVLNRARLAARARRAEPADGLVRIGYATGSKTHQADFAQAGPAVARILREHPQCRLVLFTGQWGPVMDVAEFPDFDGLADQVEWRQFVPIDDLPSELARFDVNLAPLEVDNIFCEAKSELKYFEAALVDVPTVASPTEPYRMAIREGETGFLAGTTEEWYAALKRLVEDPGLRRRVAKAALLDSIVRYGPERRGEMFESMIEQTLMRGRRGARAFATDIARRIDEPPPRPVTPDHEVLFERDLLGEAQVTVVIPLYNYAQHVVEALESVRAQTIRSIDLIVVDDVSTDDSARVALAWMEANALRFNRIVLLRNLENAGLALTRNVGFANADTAYVLPLDADNRLASRAAERLLARLQASPATFAYPLSREFGDVETAEDRPPLGITPFDPGRFLNANFIDAMALVRRSAWAAVGGYDHIRFGWEDYDFWCKLVEQGMFGEQVPEVLAEYRVHRGSMLRSQTDLENNKRLLIADIQKRHPWLRVGEAEQNLPPPAAPAIVHPRSAAEQASRLERFLPHLRCPKTGGRLLLRDDGLGVVGSDRVWPMAHGRPVLFADLGEPRVMPGEHVSNELPQRAIDLIEQTPGLVLNLSAGGSARSFDHVVEAEFAVFRHTDVLADAHALPFADATFELVVSMNAFEHYHSPRQAADEIMRVLKPGGRVLVRTAFLQPLHEAPWHFYNCTRYGLERWFERFEGEDLQVSDNFNPIHSLAWFMSDAEALLRRELSDADADRFGAASAREFIALWRDPTTRDHPVWRSFFDLPRSAQEGLAAGFEYLGRKPS
jgi:GT2 family glycosyltransferase/SAM-dependent methyltransferase